MLKQVVILSVLASAVYGFGWNWKSGLKVRFGLSDSFHQVPRTLSEATTEGWEQLQRPSGPLASLIMLCPQERLLCALYDDTGNVAGLQVALPVDEFEGAVYDWATQGFTLWETVTDGEAKSYWTTQQYFVSEEYLQRSKESRLADPRNGETLRENAVWVTGFNGELLKISADGDDIKHRSDFTEQACIPLMGRHYYYKMDENLVCGADTLFPWFPLVNSGQLVGLGFISVGTLEEKEGRRDWFERPPRTAVQVIVPRGPECLYELSDSPGLLTMHTYFVDRPQLIGCLF